MINNLAPTYNYEIKDFQHLPQLELKFSAY